VNVSNCQRGSGARADISETTSATARLALQLTAAQQIAHIGSWEWDLTSESLRWSDELYRIYGLQPQSIAMSFDVFTSKLHPEDRERVHSHVRTALEQGGRFAYGERIVRPSGELRYLETVGEALQDPNGRVTSLIGSCRDVTDERQRDEALRLYADIAQNVQIGLSVWRLEPAVPEPRLVLVAFNSATEQVVGVSFAASIGKDLDQVLPGLANTELPEMMGQVITDGKLRELPKFRFIRPGTMRRTLAAKAFALSGARVGLAIEDVSRLTRAQELAAAERRVLELLAAGEALADVLGELIRAIEKHVPHTLGSVLLLDPETKTLRVLAAPHLPHAFNAVVDGEPIGAAAGACGTAAYSKKPVYSIDIASDPLWLNYRDTALANGLRACWSTPILSSEGAVLGTFALYYREPRGPEAEELELIARITHVAGIAIERRQLDDRLRALTGHVEAVREEERTAMAREIHDELGQALTALKMDVAWIGRQVQATRGTAESPIDARISGMSSLIDGVINQVRRISAELRPGVLDDLGLGAAIEWQVREFAQRSDIVCDFCSNASETRFDRDVSTAIFRILQETLTNVARHAQAHRVDVSLVESGDHLRLQIIDDGIGMSPEVASPTRSLGMLGMHERAHRLGGTLSVSSTPGAGTRVLVDVPLRTSVAR
jgi:PAS domain S-box-containing protein